jgi:dTDP-4-dehydrorhamnose reductase
MESEGDRPSYLVVGGSGLIGAALACALSASSIVWSTARRPLPHCNGRLLQLDLLHAYDVDLPTVDVAFLCAGVSAFAVCEADPVGTSAVNVTATCELAKRLLRQGTFVVFLSTSAVFDGATALPSELVTPSPTTSYGKQKVAAEQSLLEMDMGYGRVAVVRLTKVLTARTPVITRILESLTSGTTVSAFVDLFISPISLPYAVQALISVGSRRLGGVFHLSGSEELSYAQLTRALGANLGASPSLVDEEEVDSQTGRSRSILFRPRYPALGMPRTRQVLGIEPEPIASVVNNIVSPLHQDSV